MIKTKITEAINRQINAELYSSYLYMSMASYFDSINYKGFANWMKAQAKEELNHAMKFYNYINDRQAKVMFTSIKEPKAKWNSVLEVFEDTHNHEISVTKFIDALVDLAKAEKDYATENMLQWFVNEQVEEESSTAEIVEKLKMIKDAPGGLFILDKELGQRQHGN